MARIIITATHESVAQSDGRKWVDESHEFDNGDVQRFTYLCGLGESPAAIAAARAAWLPEYLAEREAAREAEAIADGA